MKKQGKIYYSMPEVAAMVGMTVSGARKWLMREGAAVKVAGRWKVTPSRLMAVFPEAMHGLNR